MSTKFIYIKATKGNFYVSSTACTDRCVKYSASQRKFVQCLANNRA